MDGGGGDADGGGGGGMMDAGGDSDAGGIIDSDAGTQDAGEQPQTPGSLTLTWTVNGGPKCPVDGGTVNFSGQKDPDPVPTPADASVDCTTYGYTFTDLPPGNWTFAWTLKSPEQSDISNNLSPVAVPSGGGADAGFDIAGCSFCMP
jgi:hypothetical protein